MSNKFTKENLENIENRFSNETGVRFEKHHTKNHFGSAARIGVVCACLALACAGAFATDTGKAIVEKLRFNKPVDQGVISYPYKEASKDIETSHNMPCMPVNEDEMNADYSLVRDPGHMGVDIACKKGTPVHPILDGRVKETGYNAQDGNYIIIEHEGDYTSTYKHLDTILVDNEQEVYSSTQIGTVGATGMATGPHLHLEMTYKGQQIDPTPHILCVDPPDDPGEYPEEYN